MDVNDAAGSVSQACLDQSVGFSKVGLIQGSGEDVVREELPAAGETEDVEAVIVDEVLHLAGAIVAVVGQQRRPGTARSARSIRVAPEVESGDVNTHETELPS